MLPVPLGQRVRGHQLAATIVPFVTKGRVSVSLIKLSVLSLALVLALGVQTAHAATGTASLTNFKFTLTDLDPNDGITPSLVFSNNYGSSLVEGDVYTVFNGAPSPNYLDSRSGLFSQVSNSLPFKGAPAESSVTANGLYASATSSPGTIKLFEAAVSAYDPVANQYIGSIFLSAKSKLTVTADFEGSATSSSCLYACSVLALGQINFDDLTYFNAISSGFKAASAYNGNGSFYDLVTGEIATSLYNTTTAQRGFNFKAFAMVLTIDRELVAPAVPEPETYVLMLGGLGMLGLGSKRLRH
jgi:hypothetical protein